MFSFECIFSISDVKSASRPLIWLLFSVLLGWIDKGFHAVWVGACIFLKVHNIELVGEAFLNVSNREIEPLGVVQSIEIEVQVQVVLIFVYFFYLTQITRFKTAIEEQSCFFQLTESYWNRIFKYLLRSPVSVCFLSDTSKETLFGFRTGGVVALMLLIKVLRFLLNFKVSTSIGELFQL